MLSAFYEQAGAASQAARVAPPQQMAVRSSDGPRDGADACLSIPTMMGLRLALAEVLP